MNTVSGRRWSHGDRPSTGQPPRPRDSASGASSSDDDRWTTRKTRNEREDLYASRERDRATLVRRRRDGRDARPPRDADRARPRGQEQAHLRPAHGHGRPRHRAQRVPDHGDARQADVQGLCPPQRLSRRVQGGDARSPPQPPPGGGHPPDREGDAAAQPAGNPDASEAQGLCGERSSAPGPEARAARLIEEP